MNAEQFAKIADAFLNPPDGIEPSFRQVAKLLGHSQRTVRSAYLNGYGGMQSVAEMLEDRRRRAVLKRLQERERVQQALKGIHARLLSRVGTALAEVPVNLEPITSAKSAQQAVAALRELSALADELHGDRESAPTVSVSVNVGVDDSRYVGKTPEHIATMKSAESVMLKHPALFTPEHEAQTCELIARRWLMTHPERENEDESVTEQRRLLQSLYPGEADDPAIRAALKSAVADEEEDE